MAKFQAEKKIDAVLDQEGLQAVAADVARHFEGQEYEVDSSIRAHASETVPA